MVHDWFPLVTFLRFLEDEQEGPAEAVETGWVPSLFFLKGFLSSQEKEKCMNLQSALFEYEIDPSPIAANFIPSIYHSPKYN